MKEIFLKKDIKTFHCEIKSVDSQKRIIEGWANTRYPDRVNDIVDPKAFEESLKVYMANPVILAMHDQEKLPIGKTLQATIAQDGLWIRAEIAPKGTSQLADEVWGLIEFGALKALSIGYRPIEVELDESGMYAILKNLELMEISVVSVPANRESLFSVAKSFHAGTDLVEKAAPKIGFEKTKGEIKALETVLTREFKNLDESNKLFVESFLARLQDVVNSESEILELEIEVLELENALH